jgi:predicted SAM-dependent methyltransferase
VRLNIGAGYEQLPGWTAVDLYDGPGERWDARSLPLEDNSVEAILANHSLEHLGRDEVPEALAEFYRVLVPSGMLTIDVPDLEWVLAAWLDGRLDRWGYGLDAIYGSQEHVGNFHKTGFDLKHLIALVTGAGFEIQSAGPHLSHGVQSLLVQGRKP